MKRPPEVTGLYPGAFDPGYDTLAERHAYAMGYFDGFYDMPKGVRDTEKHWPNAFSRGYWEGHADGN